MMVLNDKQIAKRAAQGMIEPFVDKQVREVVVESNYEGKLASTTGKKRIKVVSYGLSSFGYDIRIGTKFKVFSNAHGCPVIDPKNFEPKVLVEIEVEPHEAVIIPPNSYALGLSLEYFRIPTDIVTICLGKCLAGDTRVVDGETGAYVPIKEMKAGKSIGLNGLKMGEVEVESVISNGVKPVFELTTRTGLKIKATANHPFLQFGGRWTELQKLKKGDRIAVAREIPIFGEYDMPDAEAVLLGMMVSEGTCHTPNSSPCFTNSDPVLVELASKMAEELGFVVTDNKNGSYRLVNRAGRGGVMEKNKATLWLEKFGLNVGASDKFVPQEIFMAKKEKVRLFLQMLFSGDGTVYQSGDAVYVEYSSSSERLVRDVKHLLSRFGIVSMVRTKNTPHGPTWWVQITDIDEVKKFLGTIGFVPGSEKDVRWRSFGLDERVSKKSNFDTFPSEAWGLLKEYIHGRGESYRSLGISGIHPGQSLGRKLVKKVLSEVRSRQIDSGAMLQEWLNGPLWDEVVDVVYVGDEETFDLSVKDVHNFVANDFIVHNSTYARSGILVNVTPFEPCYSADTECLTIEGWKLLKDVKIGEQIATLNDKSELEYHPVERKQEYDYDGDMIHFAGRSIDLLVTPEHKVYAKNRYHDRYELIEARDIYKRYNWKMKRDAEWTGLRRETVEVAGETVDTDLWLQFLGYWIGDGSVTFNSKKKHYQIRLACFKDRKVKKYGKVLEKLPFKFSRIGTGYSCLNKALYEELVEFAGCENKRVPDWVMSLDVSHLDVLLDALIESDGNRGTMTYKTASKQLADQLQEIALKTGRVSIIRRLDAETQNTQSNGDIKATRTSYVLRFCSGQTEPKVSPATQHKVHYTGKVYDVTVKNHVLYVRRNGKPVWSGNCWRGYAVLEISNMTPLPAKVYAGEGIAQVLFLKGEPPATTYADRHGRYQDQRDIVTSKV